MIREMMRPKQCDLHIKIPEEYLDRDIELIIFALDEKEIEIKASISNIERNSLRGIFNQYADSSKIELENGAWSKHVKENFAKND